MFTFQKAICYSGYRENENPHQDIHPSDKEVLEDLLILSKHYKYIRMYNPYIHAKTVLRVIKANNIDLKVMLGVEPLGEISNPNCPWGGLHSDEEIKKHKVYNYKQLDELIKLANDYKDIILALSVGNENTASWHPNKMDPYTLKEHVLYLKSKTDVLVTFNEGAWEWRNHCQPLSEVVDFISIHVYPLWHKIPLNEAIPMTIKEYEETYNTYPDIPIIFTEFGWTTSAGHQMDATQTNELNQKLYLDALDEWSNRKQVTMFIFEAFDEPWKGGKDPHEPEKHWGIYNVDRTPKLWIK